jgi:hypothetical protein
MEKVVLTLLDDTLKADWAELEAMGVQDKPL